MERIVSKEYVDDIINDSQMTNCKKQEILVDYYYHIAYTCDDHDRARKLTLMKYVKEQLEGLPL